jgi:hypothetical protein
MTAIDPDKQPSLAATHGVKMYNAALIEVADRRVIVQGTDEAEFAIGIQRALRERQVQLCFVEGHNEYAIDNEEFHTHMDSGSSHSHDDAASKVIETTGHGIGRLRRTLESVGYDVQRLPLATVTEIPSDCAVVIDANPRTTWLPGESLALKSYLEQGGAALLMFDLGFSLEPGLQELLGTLGARMTQSVVVDRLSHYGTDEEMVAVTGYDPHPITRHVAYSFYPGVRPLALAAPTAGVTTTALIRSGNTSTTRAVAAADRRDVAPAGNAPPSDDTPQSRTLASASEGTLTAGGKAMRQCHSCSVLAREAASSVKAAIVAACSLAERASAGPSPVSSSKVSDPPKPSRVASVGAPESTSPPKPTAVANSGTLCRFGNAAKP